jgi:hypothetical protein
MARHLFVTHWSGSHHNICARPAICFSALVVLLRVFGAVTQQRLLCSCLFLNTTAMAITLYLLLQIPPPPPIALLSL